MQSSDPAGTEPAACLWVQAEDTVLCTSLTHGHTILNCVTVQQVLLMRVSPALGEGPHPPKGKYLASLLLPNRTQGPSLGQGTL